MRKLRFIGRPKCQNWLYNERKITGKFPPHIAIAKVCDLSIIPFYQMETLERICKQLNYEIKTRKEITDYQSRRIPKIQISINKYYLVKNKLDRVV